MAQNLQGKQKLLIIRFSSFGDVIQTLGVVDTFLRKYPGSTIHWAVRSDFKDLVSHHPSISKVFPLERKTGLRGLFQMGLALKNENYTHVYDAHNNIRSRVLSLFLCPPNFLRRSKNRIKRILLFIFRKNLFGPKFIQQESFLKPLEAWNMPYELPRTSQLYLPQNAISNAKILIPASFQSNFIAVVPSSAWELKMWPLDHWKKLFQFNPQKNFVILGGPQDDFIHSLIPDGSKNIVNLAGKLSIIESCAVISLSQLTIGNDTGLSHAADQLQVPLLQFIGPVLFGYPASKTSQVLEVPLPCRPCTKDGRGNCKIAETKKCLSDITPDWVTREILKIEKTSL